MKGEFERLVSRNESNGKRLHSDLVREWVRGARKEFPELLYPTTTEYDGTTAWCNPRKAAKWFEKWFGKADEG